jgi:hypothetical protein
MGWSIVASYRVFFNTPAPIIIAIDANGTRIVTQVEDPIFRTEVVKFIQTFLEESFNFSAETFSKNVGEATNLMSETYWQSSRGKVMELKGFVESKGLSYSSVIERISRVDEDHFQALLGVEESSRLQKRNYKLLLDLRIKSAKRTRINPWGMEVDDVQEKHLE